MGTRCRGIVERDKVNTIRTRQIGPKRYVSAEEDARGNENRKEHESLKEHRVRNISVLFIVILPLNVLFVGWKIFRLCVVRDSGKLLISVKRFVAKGLSNEVHVTYKERNIQRSDVFTLLTIIRTIAEAEDFYFRAFSLGKSNRYRQRSRCPQTP